MGCNTPRFVDELIEFGHQVLEDEPKDEPDSAVAVSVKTHQI